MARLVDRELKKPIARALVFGELVEGGVAIVEVEADALKVTFRAA